MAKYATPVSKQNYMECWKHVWTKYGQAKRSYFIGKLVGILGELAYLASMLFISFGGLYTLKVPVINELLDSIPHLVPLWEKFSALVFKPDMTPPRPDCARHSGCLCGPHRSECRHGCAGISSVSPRPQKA